MSPLILKLTAALRRLWRWCDDDYVVLENGVVVGRIFKVPVVPQDRPWMGASGLRRASPLLDNAGVVAAAIVLASTLSKLN